MSAPLPTRSSSRAARPAPESMQPRQSPLHGLPPLLVPAQGHAHGPLPPIPTKESPTAASMDVHTTTTTTMTVGGQGMKRYESPLKGVPALLAPASASASKGNDIPEKPYIPALPASPSLDIAFFSGPNGPPPSYTGPANGSQPTTYSARSPHAPIPALSSPPREELPLPPVPPAKHVKNLSPAGTTLSPTPRTASRTPSPIPASTTTSAGAGVRSPSPLSPFSGHGEIKPSYKAAGGAHLQGLGLGPVSRQTTNGLAGQPRSVSSPIVHVIASSDPQPRAAHRDLPPIVTSSFSSPLPSAAAYRSVSASSPHIGPSPSRKPSAPAPLDLKQSNTTTTSSNYRQFAGSQLLSPGMGMASPGFSPTNVVVDSLIEEMQDEDGPAAAAGASGTPVRKTSILDRPRPRASSRSSSYRADPLVHTPTHQATFSPGLQDDTLFPADRNPYFRPPRARLTDMIQHERIQQALLPKLSIASFLALLGALDKRWRKCISGEVVGKWVVKEWGLVLGPDVAWPGLGVWEGFLESLLHNPEAYPTYPPHFTPLLRHLSLSHTLIVLFLRSLPPTAYPTMPPFPFEDDPATNTLSHSVSSLSLSNGPRARTISGPGSEHGGGGGGGAHARMPFVPKAERVVELVMPEPLSAIRSVDPSQELLSAPSPNLPLGHTSRQQKRRSSIGSASFVSWTKERRGSQSSSSAVSSALPRREGKKATPPPVSFPSAKRYVFKGFGEPTFTHSRKRNSFDGGGPGSIFSVDEAAGGGGAGRSLYGDSSGGSTFPSRYGQARSRPFGEQFASKHSLSHHSPSTSSLARFAGNNYDDRTATSSPTFGRYHPSTPQQVEPAFQKPIPYVVGRVPILRVFVPLSAEVPSWPCAEGARRARHELERCGAWSKLRLGDVIVNTALKEPLLTRHLMLFVPTMQPYLVPLEYRFSLDGHLPGYFDAFQVPPSYYYSLLTPPFIIAPDLSPWADSAVNSLRLAFERSDITTTRGEKVVAKRYLHVCGFEITAEAGHLASEEWQGMVTLEAEGTAEGRTSMLRRLGRSLNESRIPAQRGPWEIVPEKSLGGTVWLRLVPEKTAMTSPV